jgi:hypothetical protein
VPTPEDERFENYLRQFRPLVPDALPIQRRESASSRYRVLAIWCAGAAAVIVVGTFGFRMIRSRVSQSPRTSEPVVLNAPMRPLTMSAANALLATAPSYKSALDEMAFHPQRSTVPKDKQSAISVLAKEKIKL